MKRPIKIILLAFIGLCILFVGGLLGAGIVLLRQSGIPLNYASRVAQEVSYRATHPTRAYDGCVIANGGISCCDPGSDCSITLSLSDTDYCYRYNRTCRVQSNGHCGWDAQDSARVKKCVDEKEYPPFEISK